MRSASLLHRMQQHNREITALVFSPASNLLATCGKVCMCPLSLAPKPLTHLLSLSIYLSLSLSLTHSLTHSLSLSRPLSLDLSLDLSMAPVPPMATTVSFEMPESPTTSARTGMAPMPRNCRRNRAGWGEGVCRKRTDGYKDKETVHTCHHPRPPPAPASRLGGLVAPRGGSR